MPSGLLLCANSSDAGAVTEVRPLMSVVEQRQWEELSAFRDAVHHYPFWRL